MKVECCFLGPGEQCSNTESNDEFGADTFALMKYIDLVADCAGQCCSPGTGLVLLSRIIIENDCQAAGAAETVKLAMLNPADIFGG